MKLGHRGAKLEHLISTTKNKLCTIQKLMCSIPNSSKYTAYYLTHSNTFKYLGLQKRQHKLKQFVSRKLDNTAQKPFKLNFMSAG